MSIFKSKKQGELITDSGFTEKRGKHGDVIVIIVCAALIAYLLYLGIMAFLV